MMNKLFLFLILACLAGGASAQYRFNDSASSEQYRAKFTVSNCAGGLCGGKATITLIDKITGKEVYFFSSADLDFSLKGNQNPHDGITELGKYQSPLIFGDFNFDGTEDLAIRNGNKSAYNDPSYDVYLSSGNAGKFTLNKELTNLASTNSGMFSIDRKNKQLSIYQKNGCCYNKTTYYKFDCKKGLTEVSSVIEDSSIGDDVVVITQKLINGKIKKTIERFKTADYYKQDTN